MSEEKGNRLPTIKIGKKEYVQVDDRVMEFHRLYSNGRIVTKYKMLGDPGSFVFITTTKVIPDISLPDRYFTGFAYEHEGSSQVNERSALENCETSSVGRALGFLNIGLISGSGIASADEMQNAVQDRGPVSHSSGPKIDAPATSPKMDGPATEKQVNFISRLRSQILEEAVKAGNRDAAEKALTALTDEFRPEGGGEVLKSDASEFIDRLQEVKTKYGLPF
jgi:hypothetical protein